MGTRVIMDTHWTFKKFLGHMRRWLQTEMSCCVEHIKHGWNSRGDSVEVICHELIM